MSLSPTKASDPEDHLPLSQIKENLELTDDVTEEQPLSGASDFSVSEPQGNISVTNEQYKELEQRQIDYKKLALKLKKEGNLPKAREMLIYSKKAQDQLDRAKAGLSVSLDAIPLPKDIEASILSAKTSEKPVSIETSKVDPEKSAEVVTSPTKSKVKTPTASRSRQTSQAPASEVKKGLSLSSKPISTSDILSDTSITFSPNTSKDIFTHLRESLQTQIASCTSLAATFFKAGHKDKALDFHKKKKVYMADLETLEALNVTQGASPPSFIYTLINYEIEISFPEIGLNEMEVSVLKAFDLNALVGSEKNISISYLLDGLTEDNNSTDAKGETPIFKAETTTGIDQIYRCLVI